MQRRVAQEKHNKDDIHKPVAISYAKSLDAAVEKAYMHVISCPRIGFNLDGHTSNWVRKWKKHLNAQRVNLFAGSFGLAVESLASKIYLPPPPSGYDFELQGIREGTIPDVILMKDGYDVSWLDITASESEGHIWEKGPPFWKDQDHASEIVYPSLTESSVCMMEENDGNAAPQDFNLAEFEEKKNETALLADLRAEERAWQKQGLTILLKEQFRNVKRDSAQKLIKQSKAMFALRDYFKLNIENDIITYNKRKKYYADDAVDNYEEGDAKKLRKDAPFLLSALGIDPKTYGFSESGVSRGIKLLQTYNPGMFQPADLIDPVFRDDISSDDSEDDTDADAVNDKKRKLPDSDKADDPGPRKKRRTGST